MKTNPMLLTDFYKSIHHLAYVEGMDYLVSYWTPRMSRLEGVDKVVMFGLQGFIKEYLIEMFNDEFFNKPKEEVMSFYRRIMLNTMSKEAADTSHLELLYDLGYLPIQIKAIDEGERVNLKTPMFEISNTISGFGWIVNALETLMSTHIWQAMTSATIAFEYRKIVNEYFEKTVSNNSNLLVMPKDKGGNTHGLQGTVTNLDSNRNAACGDFSMRGMGGADAASKSSAAHLLSFSGTATIPAILWLEDYYNCNSDTEVVGKGVPSTEHSVMSSYGREGEFDCYKRLINEVFKTGPLSIVSDTYDYWNVLTNFLPKLREDILEREGKIIIRGDSGDPVDIICGNEVITFNSENDFLFDANITWFYNKKQQVKVGDDFYKAVKLNDCNGDYSTPRLYDSINGEKLVWVKTEALPENKGTIEILWEIFGGYINDKGYKVLNPKIGAIYGDSITLQRAKEIYGRLEAKGFAVNNCKLGVGSYTYQYNTRDSLGFALKSTHSVVEGLDRQIYKDPKTDNDKFKKSQRGMIYVYKDGEDILYTDEHTIEELKDSKYRDNMLKLVFKDGKMVKEQSLKDIREKLHSGKF